MSAAPAASAALVAEPPNGGALLAVADHAGAAAAAAAAAAAHDAEFREHGATDSEAAELRAYAQNGFDLTGAPRAGALPLADEPFVTAWARYAAEAERDGAAAVLRRCLVQLRFPVAPGVSASEAYRAATRRGVLPDGGDVAGHVAGGVRFARPEAIRVFLHATAAGQLPVVVAGAREDFVTLVQALTRRNEPDAVPPSMGACIVAGYNNWDRVGELRRAWAAEQGGDAGAAAWAAAFQRLVPHTDRYQDRFVLLSDGPYSATPAAALGLGEREWLDASLKIRLEHECAHYFTRRAFGSMRNTLLDELIADYAGIVAAAGRFRADWFLRFMGLEAFPAYRPTGRLANYRGTPPLGDGAFRVLQRVVVAAASNLARFDAGAGAALRQTRFGVARVIVGLARTGLARLADPDGAEALAAATREASG